MSTLKINHQTIEFTPPQPLSALLEQAGISHPHPCGGRGVCGNCGVQIEGELSPLTPAEQKAGTRLSCQTVVLGDATMTYGAPAQMQIEGGGGALQQTIPSSTSTEDVASIFRTAVEKSPDCRQGLLAAVDIGTTTVVVQVYDLTTNSLYGSAADLNPQTALAADVMGRIDAALNDKGAKLQQQITDALKELLTRAAGGKLTRIKQMVITGNTAMLYLLTGRSPHSLATAPFEADFLFDNEDTLFDIPVYFPPCISAFVGADISCALLSADICHGEQPILLCDVGTNGEIALWTGKEMLVTSTAAGPAFEGAGISCGMLGQSGAVDRIWVEDDKICHHTIDELPPRGLCGSGLMDAIAVGLQTEIIDDTGYLEEDPWQICDNVSLIGSDVRNVQLAKSAIAAGIGALLHHAGLSAERIERCIIAGGFGKHLRAESVCAIGLLPPALEHRIQAVGNAALAGATQLLLHPESREKIRELTTLARHIELGGDPTFNELYIENMMFE